VLECVVRDLEDGFPVCLRVTVRAGCHLMLYGEGEHKVDFFAPFHLGTVNDLLTNELRAAYLLSRSCRSHAYVRVGVRVHVGGFWFGKCQLRRLEV
jgi:hypothetical protein